MTDQEQKTAEEQTAAENQAAAQSNSVDDTAATDTLANEGGALAHSEGDGAENPTVSNAAESSTTNPTGATSTESASTAETNTSNEGGASGGGGGQQAASTGATSSADTKAANAGDVEAQGHALIDQQQHGIYFEPNHLRAKIVAGVHKLEPREKMTPTQQKQAMNDVQKFTFGFVIYRGFRYRTDAQGKSRCVVVYEYKGKDYDLDFSLVEQNRNHAPFIRRELLKAGIPSAALDAYWRECEEELTAIRAKNRGKA